MSKIDGLTSRQARFVEEYPKDWNGTKAAIRAGYSKSTARMQASRLLTNENIASRVREAQAQMISRVKVEQDDVLKELLIVLKSNVSDFQISEGNQLTTREGVSDDAMKAVSSIKRRIRRYVEGKGADAQPVEIEEMEYRLWDKTRAIEMGMKHLGLMFDRLKIEDPDDLLAKVLGIEKESLPE